MRKTLVPLVSPASLVRRASLWQLRTTALDPAVSEAAYSA
jgi:hypothetical protein